MRRPLLMIPGPVELSPAVAQAAASLPPGHMSPAFVEAFGRSLGALRSVFGAGEDSQIFVCSGSGTTAMDMAAANLIAPGTRVLVLWSGYFSDRMAEIARRHGASATLVYPGGGTRFDAAMIGQVPSAADVDAAIAQNGPHALLFATHVDTSTGARVDAEAIAKVARAHAMLSVFDGVCATAGERFELEAWGADVCFTASQKALGLPPGLALLVASPRALELRARRTHSAPPLVLDWLQWIPIMQGYAQGSPKYFATPATSLILALDAGLAELTGLGLDQVFRLQKQAASRMRAAWKSLGLRSLVAQENNMAETLSALYYPQGVDASLVKRVAGQGLIIAGGLLPPIAGDYFRVGHMGYAARVPEMLDRAVEALTTALSER